MTPHDIAADLRWYFRDSDGAMGMRSNFAAMVAQLEGGGHAAPASYEMDERALAAASRAREARRALRNCPPWAAVVLGLALRRESDERWPLSSVLSPGEELRLACALSSAAAEHRRSRSKRALPDWLWRQTRAKDAAKRRVWDRLRVEVQDLLSAAFLEYMRACEG